MDCCPYPIDWNNLKRFKYMYEVMKRTADRLVMDELVSCKFRFGADFNMDGNLTNDKFIDLPHVEMVF
jgi:hypothetical protein